MVWKVAGKTFMTSIVVYAMVRMVMGLGYLVREDGGVYPAQPANFLLEEFVQASEGRYYHSIMYGKNVMGGYADKLSYEERWQVIHYIRSLQAKELSVWPTMKRQMN